jgi:hypothetical protein
MFSFALTRQQYNVDIQYRGKVTALLRLADELPEELVHMDSADYNRFVFSLSTMRSTLEFEPWISGGHPNAQLYGMALGEAISTLRTCISPLSDQQIPEATTGLPFITDAPLRESIRADIAFADQAFSGGEWKAATVLAGAAAEALLLWAITAKKTKTEVGAARSATIPKASSDPNRWGLDEYIKVAHNLGLIGDNAAKQADLAKHFRNLIHPGRSARLKEVCDKGTAHSALAALELVLRDIS